MRFGTQTEVLIGEIDKSVVEHGKTALNAMTEDGDPMTGEYEKWQSLLSSEFLSPRDGPTVLFIDDSELSRLHPEAEDAAYDLAKAVGNRLKLSDGRSMFAPIMATYQRWMSSSQDDAPPVLPVVALTVLAATRMRSDAEARSTNYYLRLAQALTPGADASAIQTLRKDLRERGAFLDAMEMWRGLHNWIERQEGAVGTSTIRDHPYLQRIGYPLSQALVRQSDRMTLTRFFQALDFTPGPPPDAEVIVDVLDIWTATDQNRLSGAFMRALGDADLRPLLATVIEAHAQAWDGRVLTIDGKQRIAMRLCIDLEAWQASWLFPVPPSGPDALTVLAPNGAHEVRLTTSVGLDYYSVQGNPAVTPELLVSGMQLRGREYTAEFPPAPVIFLSPDLQTGAWSSSPEILPFEDHLVAVRDADSSEFRRMLSEAAAEGWRSIPQRGSVLLPGYALFQDVRFTDGQGLSRFPELRRLGITPAVVPRARLTGGLRLATSISATHYLAGGEPDLLLPSRTDGHSVVVTLDGRREQLQANGFPLELRRFINYTGRHIINVDNQELTFTTLEEGPDPAPPPGTATIGWTSDGQMSMQTQRFVITGAHVANGVDSPPILAWRGRDESWLLHRDGRTESVSEPATPRFLSTIDIDLYSQRFEISSPTSARWLAQRRGTRWQLTEIGPADPAEYSLEIDVLDAWKWACSDAKGAQLWELQLHIAERVT